MGGFAVGSGVNPRAVRDSSVKLNRRQVEKWSIVGHGLKVGCGVGFLWVLVGFRVWWCFVRWWPVVQVCWGGVNTGQVRCGSFPRGPGTVGTLSWPDGPAELCQAAREAATHDRARVGVEAALASFVDPGSTAEGWPPGPVGDWPTTKPSYPEKRLAWPTPRARGATPERTLFGQARLVVCIGPVCEVPRLNRVAGRCLLNHVARAEQATCLSGCGANTPG